MKHLTVLISILLSSSVSAQTFDYVWEESPTNTVLSVKIPAKNLPERIDFVSVLWTGSANIKLQDSTIAVGNIKLRSQDNENWILTLEKYIYTKNRSKKVRWSPEFRKTLALAIIDELTFYLD